jgi:hypothetical protein
VTDNPWMETWGSGTKETLTRACANCATEYPLEDPTCPNCFRPANLRYSRWRGGPTSLSLPTKLTLTGLLLGMNVAHTVWMFSSLHWAAWPRVIEVGVLLLLPIPFLFRRARV